MVMMMMVVVVMMMTVRMMMRVRMIGPEPRTTLCASLRSRNACQDCARATSHGNLQKKCRSPEWAPWSSTGLYTYRKNPSVWTHCLGNFNQKAKIVDFNKHPRLGLLPENQELEPVLFCQISAKFSLKNVFSFWSLFTYFRILILNKPWSQRISAGGTPLESIFAIGWAQVRPTTNPYKRFYWPRHFSA